MSAYNSILLWSLLLIKICLGQLKACYQAVEGQVAGDFPCNPDANVSSCCSPGNICSSNLFCISASNHQNYVGTCTDRTWSSPACPFNLSWCLLLIPYPTHTSAGYLYQSTDNNNYLPPLASGVFDPHYDKFSYALNTTQCPDGTLCPLTNNQNCCDAKQGVREIQFNNYNGSAVMPADVSKLSAYYSAAGYAFPTLLTGSPITARLTTTSSTESNNPTLPTFFHTDPNPFPSDDVREFHHVTTDYTFPTSTSNSSAVSSLSFFPPQLTLSGLGSSTENFLFRQSPHPHPHPPPP